MEKLNNTYNVIVSERAANMLVSHAAFLAEISEKAADRLVVSFEKAVESLKLMPYRCPVFNAHIPKNTYRRLLFESRYLIIYQIQDDNVYIDYVIDCRQDYEWMVR